MLKGQIIGGEIGKLCIRKRSDSSIDLGELLIVEGNGSKILLQVYDLLYSSQLSQSNLELVSGIKLEEGKAVEFFDEKLRNYIIALSKPLVVLNGRNALLCKCLPSFFSDVRAVRRADLDFLTIPPKPIFLGNLRSGSNVIDVPINLPGEKVLTHHVLVPATTGRGKSNLVKVLLWDLVDKEYVGVLVLDPHDEYYGCHGPGLKDHPVSKKVTYYTDRNPLPNTNTLRINVNLIKPNHFRGAVGFSDPQWQAINSFFKEYSSGWIEAIVLERPLKVTYSDATLAVVRRRILSLLSLEVSDGRLYSKGIFSLNNGETIVEDISARLENGDIVIINTSTISGSVEILIGALITTELFNRYRRYKMNGTLNEKPVLSIVIEEAPRVLGKEVLESGPNIFSTIAREGRKFKVGLLAITQLPSLIPRQILANMNTKIILGIEMKPERQAIIESASQDLSQDDRSIASLDTGEAILTSNFSKFAIPLKIPFFDDLVKKSVNKCDKDVVQEFVGVMK